MKKKVTYTLDNDILNKLKEYSKNSMIPQSKIIEKLIIDFLKNNKGI